MYFTILQCNEARYTVYSVMKNSKSKSMPAHCYFLYHSLIHPPCSPSTLFVLSSPVQHRHFLSYKLQPSTFNLLLGRDTPIVESDGYYDLYQLYRLHRTVSIICPPVLSSGSCLACSYAPLPTRTYTHPHMDTLTYIYTHSHTYTYTHRQIYV